MDLVFLGFQEQKIQKMDARGWRPWENVAVGLGDGYAHRRNSMLKKKKKKMVTVQKLGVLL